MDVTHQFQQISPPTTPDPLIPALEEVSNAPMPPVVVLGLSKLCPLHDLGQRNLAGLKQQVDVVGHQHVGIKLKVVPLSVMLYSLKVGSAVLIVSKDVLPLVASDNGMIEGPCKFNPWFPCHNKNFPGSREISQ